LIEFLRQLRRHDTAATVAVAVDGHPADLAVCNGVLALAARQLGNLAIWQLGNPATREPLIAKSLDRLIAKLQRVYRR